MFSVCARLWCLPLSYYLLPLPRHLWGSSVHRFPSAVRDPLAGVMLSFYFSCVSFWGTLTVFCLVPRLSFVSSSLSGLLLLCRISLVFFPGSLSPSVVRLRRFSSISSFLVSPFWLAAGLPPWLFSFRVAFLHRFLLPSPAPSLSLSWPSPSSCGVTVLCTVRSFGCGVVSTCFHYLLLLGVSCSFFAWVPGCFVTLASCCLCAVLLSSWGSRLLRSRLPPSSSFLLEFLSFAPPWLCLAISFLRFFSCDLHPDVSASAFPDYCLFRSSALLLLYNHTFPEYLISTLLIPAESTDIHTDRENEKLPQTTLPTITGSYANYPPSLSFQDTLLHTH